MFIDIFVDSCDYLGMMKVWTILLLTCGLFGQGLSKFTATPMKITSFKDLKVLTLNCSHDNPETTAILKIEITKMESQPAAAGRPQPLGPLNPYANQNGGQRQVPINPAQGGVIPGQRGYVNPAYNAPYSTFQKGLYGVPAGQYYGKGRRKRRSVFQGPRYGHPMFKRQTTLKTATLGGGNIIQFIPNNGRFNGQGRMQRPAYLTVDVTHPDENDGGRYVCTIAHMTSKGEVHDEFVVDVITASSNFDIPMDKHSIGELEKRVSKLENQLPAMSAMGKAMNNIVKSDVDKRKEMEDEIEKLKKENRDLIAAVDELKEKFKVLSDRATAFMEAQNAKPVIAQSVQPAKGQNLPNINLGTTQEVKASTTNKDNVKKPTTLGNGAVPVPGKPGFPGNGGYQNGYVNNGAYNGFPRGYPGQPVNPYYYPNAAYGGYRQPLPPQQQQQQQGQQRPPYQGAVPNQPYGVPPGYNPNAYGNGYGYQGPPAVVPHLKTDDLTKLTARMNDLENVRISALEKDLKDIKKLWMEPLSDNFNAVEIYVNGTVKPLLDQMQSVNWQDLTKRLTNIEKMAIPELFKNLTYAQKHITMLHKAIDLMKGREKVPKDKVAQVLGEITLGNDKGDDDKKTTDLTESNETLNPLMEGSNDVTDKKTDPSFTSSTPSISGMSCYVCGDNETQTSCVPKTNDDIKACDEEESYCMTDVYQNGRLRNIYKRCVTKAVCKNDSKNSDSACATTSFLVPDTMECHYCCTSKDCNGYIRPQKDMYKDG